MGWKLALVAIFGCLPALLAAGFMRMRMDTRAQELRAAFFVESARFGVEAVEAIRTVVSLGLEAKVVQGYGERLVNAVARSRRALGGSMALYAASDSVDLLGELLLILTFSSNSSDVSISI